VAYLGVYSVFVLGEVIELLSGARQVGEVLVPCYKEVLDHLGPFLISRWLQGDCRENDSEQRQIQNGGQMPCFSPACI
jgi:hypothetical protein